MVSIDRYEEWFVFVPVMNWTYCCSLNTRANLTCPYRLYWPVDSGLYPGEAVFFSINMMDVYIHADVFSYGRSKNKRINPIIVISLLTLRRRLLLCLLRLFRKKCWLWNNFRQKTHRSAFFCWRTFPVVERKSAEKFAPRGVLSCYTVHVWPCLLYTSPSPRD